MINPLAEQITGVAIWKGDRSGFMTLARPARHHDLIALMTKMGCGKPFGKQGFVTSTGRFVDREVGLLVARFSGQVGEDTIAPPRLFSEDLW